jgi:CRP-like cAMP-binding protein
VVRKGVVVDFAYTLRGDPYVFAVFGKGSVLGVDASFASLINDSLLPLEDVEFCLVTFKILELALASNESLLNEIVTIGNMSINAFGKYSWMLQGKSAADRVLRFFSLYLLLDAPTQGDIAITVSQENLALIIGSERATVTKILKRFAKSEIVELKPRSIVVKQEYWSSKLCRPENVWDEYSY